MSLTLSATIAERGVDIRMDVNQGETVAVLGRNGSGKSSVLSVIAGLLRPDRGAASLEGTSLFRIAAESGSGDTWVAPHRRGIALLAQEPTLFPHLSALDNVAFGPRSAGVSRRAAREAATSWLAEVGAGDLAGRRASAVSIGQAQRIALARALAARPKLVMLDEPMAALDVSVAPVIRSMLRRVLQDRTAIIVTHDVIDAWTLADRVIVLSGGEVVEEGPTTQVLRAPRTAFTAELVGLNLLLGVRTSAGVLSDDGLELGIAPDAAAEPIPVGTRVSVLVPPSAVTIVGMEPDHGTGATPSRESEAVATIIELEPRGDLLRVRTDRLLADVTPEVAAAHDLTPGSRIRLRVDAAEVSIRSA